MDQFRTTSRRNFLALAGLGGSAAVLNNFSSTTPLLADEPAPPKTDGFQFSAEPMLQLPLDRSLAVRWMTSKPSKTWVEFGVSKEMGQNAVSSKYGLIDLSSNKHQAVLEALEPGATYHYRIVAREFLKINGYDVTYGEEIATPLKTFKALDPRRESIAFSMINDTHQNYPVVEKLLRDPRRPAADWIVLNGDATEPAGDEQLRRDLLNPLARLFAAQTPLVFVRGNHDARGSFAPHLAEYLYLPEGRFYHHFRQGPVHFTVLDTGEDKGDEHQYLRGLTDFTAYLQRQLQWMREVVFPSEACRSAAFRIVICHIPVHRGRMDFPLPWTKDWTVLFNDAKIDLMLSGHMHQNAYEKPNEDHRYHILIGGGPNEDNATRTDVQATNKVIRLSQTRPNGKTIGEWEIGPSL